MPNHESRITNTHDPASQGKQYPIFAFLEEKLTKFQNSANLRRHKAAIITKISRNSGLLGYGTIEVMLLADQQQIISQYIRQIEPNSMTLFIEFFILATYYACKRPETY